MILPDVNVWLPLVRADLETSDRVQAWMSQALAASDPVAISDLVFSAVMRIATNARVFIRPSSTEDVLAVLDGYRSHPGTVVLNPGRAHWAAFERLCRLTHATGPDVTDAFHAALAIEHKATFVSFDRGLARFPGLDVATPMR